MRKRNRGAAIWTTGAVRNITQVGGYSPAIICLLGVPSESNLGPTGALTHQHCLRCPYNMPFA